MSEIQSSGNGALRRIGGIPIKFKLFDRDLEPGRLRFVNEAFHYDMIRKKFLVEDDMKLLVRRPVFGRLEDQNVVFDPMPAPIEMRLKIDAPDRRLFQIIEARRRFAEINNQSRKFELLFQFSDLDRCDLDRDVVPLW